MNQGQHFNTAKSIGDPNLHWQLRRLIQHKYSRVLAYFPADISSASYLECTKDLEFSNHSANIPPMQNKIKSMQGNAQDGIHKALDFKFSSWSLGSKEFNHQKT